MTDELKTLAGRSPQVLKNLRWRDLIEFAEMFGVGIDEIETLRGSDRVRAFAWLFWVAEGRPCDFEEYLNRPLPEDLFQV